MRKLKSVTAAILTVAAALAWMLNTQVQAATPAKKLFGARDLPAVMTPAVHGFYSKGCLQGAVAIPADGPDWQAMRLSRNRRWGHPDLIKLVVQLSKDAKDVGWNGLLVGDISQARGGPMLTGHASHQLGLDADIWLNQMPDRRYTYEDREKISAKSMLVMDSKGRINQNKISKRFTNATMGLIKTAASYSKVQRVLVHPTIKRELCKRATGDRRWLHKVRPYWGHHYHMHMRMRCPAGSPNCKPQKEPAASEGCGAELAYWNRLMNPPKPKKSAKKRKKKKVVKRRKKRQIALADLPNACRAVLSAPAPLTAKAATVEMKDGQAFVPTPTETQAVDAIEDLIGKNTSKTTVPTPRPNL